MSVSFVPFQFHKINVAISVIQVLNTQYFSKILHTQKQ